MTSLRWARLVSWPGVRRITHETSLFKSPWIATVDLIRYELQRLAVEVATIEIDLPAHAFRSDGQLVNRELTPVTAGIVLGFVHPQRGPVRIPSDLYWGWRDNVRAIGLALEAERAKRRYGIGDHGEAFEGYRALAAGPPVMTPIAAAEVLATYSELPAGAILQYSRIFADAVKRARALTHPDNASGGDRALFDEVERAREVLATHHTAAKAT